MYSENSINKVIFVFFDGLMILLSFFVVKKISLLTALSTNIIVLIILLSISFSILMNQYSMIIKRTIIKDLPFIVNLVAYTLISQILVVLFATENPIIVVEHLFYQYFILFLAVLLSRSVIRLLLQKKNDKTNVLIMTTFENYEDTKRIIAKERFNVIAYISEHIIEGIEEPILRDFMDLRYLLANQEVNAVYITTNALKNFLEAQEYLSLIGIPIIINVTSIENSNYLKTNLETVGQDKVVIYSLNNIRTRSLFVKRFLDVSIACIGLFITGIVALIIYPIVQKESKGPLIFKQKRVGKNGKIFEIYKFRSMYIDAESRKKELMSINEVSSEHMFKMENDPRIFPFGQKIRDWSIDELPQFLNVLKGEMSIVGTRPPTIDEYQKYELHHFKRLAMKPGITGMWQVNGRSNITDFEEVVELDTKYIKSWSLLLDLKIILKTFLVILKKDGAK